MPSFLCFLLSDAGGQQAKLVEPLAIKRVQSGGIDDFACEQAAWLSTSTKALNRAVRTCGVGFVQLQHIRRWKVSMRSANSIRKIPAFPGNILVSRLTFFHAEQSFDVFDGLLGRRSISEIRSKFTRGVMLKV